MSQTTAKKPTAAERAAKSAAAAKHRIIERGIVQFRAKPELMEMLLEVAQRKGLPYGVMVRGWVTERLRQEIGA